MAQSYITQGVNIVCTNMQSGPTKLGVSRANPTVRQGSTGAWLLNTDDRKLQATLSCKMADKFWGGLGMLCAGLAIAGALVLCVVTAGAAAPALLAVAVMVSEAGIAVSAIGAVASVGMALYAEAHDCDCTLQGNWDPATVHPSVRIQKKHALLHNSVLKCPKGGTLSLIIDDATAQQAADQMISLNQREVSIHMQSKFLDGFVGGLTGGATGPGAVVAIGCYMVFESNKSNQDGTLGEDTVEGAEQYGIATAGATGEAAYDAAKETNRWVDIAAARIFSESSQESIDYAKAAAFNASKDARDILQDLGKGLLKGLPAAIVLFAVDEYFKNKEHALEEKTGDIPNSVKDKGNKNDIGIIANDVS